MCGRDTFSATWAQVREFSRPLPLIIPEVDPEPNYNRAPTQQGWAIVAGEDGAVVRPMRWGLLPPWAKDTRLAYTTINARLETAAEKPAFRDAWRQRRCLVPSSGYYEWMQLDAKAKQPYFVHHAQAPVMFYAGLWESRPDGAGGELLTYSVLTRDADQSMATLHDRMPLVLPAGVLEDWLRAGPDDALALAREVAPPPLVFHPVDRAVGNVRSTGAHLIEPVAPAAPAGQPSLS